jgi:hypothetical protein
MNTTKLELGIVVKVWIVEQYKCINDNVEKWDHNVYYAPNKTPEMWEKLKTLWTPKVWSVYASWLQYQNTLK